MITLANLKIKVAAYLNRTTASFTIGGLDLLEDAIVQAHQKAQLNYDFELAKVIVDFSLTIAGGGLVSSATLHGDAETDISVKKILACYLTDSATGTMRPINFLGRSSQNQDLRERFRGSTGLDVRYPSYPLPLQGNYPVSVVQNGDLLSLYPSDSASWNLATGASALISADVIMLLPAPSTPVGEATATSDFLMDFGDDFLLWDAICRLNPMVKEYVPRQEGNVAEPTAQRDDAWIKLLEWDAHIVASGTTSYNLD